MFIVYCSETEVTYLEKLLKRYDGSHINLKKRNYDSRRYFSNSEEYFLNSLVAKYT